MMTPVPSPLPRRFEATMSTTDGSTLARIAFTSRAAPAAGGAAVEPDPAAGSVVGVVAGGIGVVVAPPDGAVALVTAGDAESFDARLTPMAAPRLPATKAKAATPPTSAMVRLPAKSRVPLPSPGGGAGGEGNPDGPPNPGGAGGGSVGGEAGRGQSRNVPSVMRSSSPSTLGVSCEPAWSRPQVWPTPRGYRVRGFSGGLFPLRDTPVLADLAEARRVEDGRRLGLSALDDAGDPYGVAGLDGADSVPAGADDRVLVDAVGAGEAVFRLHADRRRADRGDLTRLD